LSEFILQNTSILISKDREGDTPEDFNTVITDGADFHRLETRGNPILLPVLGKSDTLDLVGSGFEFPQSPLHVNFWQQPVIPLSGDVNFDFFVLLLSRVFSGVNAVPTTVATAAREHILLLQQDDDPLGRQLASSNLVTSIGYVDNSNPGADVQWTGVVGDSVQIQQSGAALPTWNVELVGSGGFIRPVPVLTRADFPALVGDITADYPHLQSFGAAVNINYTDGTLINLATEGRIRSWSFQFNNNARRDDQRPGDPFRVADDPTSGAYVNRLLRGRRTCGAQVVVSLSEELAEFVTMQQNRIVDNLQFAMKGELIAGATPNTNYTLEVNIPKAQLRTITPGNEGDDATLTLDWYPLKGTGEYVSARAVNKRTTAYA
jgi:hypothetical protein